MSLEFPEGFRWGVATSAFQCEGAAASPDSSWTRWEALGHVRAGNRSGIACDWWANAERDFDLARSLGLGSLRGLTPLSACVLDRSRRRRREQHFFALLHLRQVGAHHALGVAVRHRATLVQPQRLVAEAFDEVQRMGDEQDRLAAPPELGELIQAFVREALISDGEHFVDEQDVRVHVNRHGKAQP